MEDQAEVEELVDLVKEKNRLVVLQEVEVAQVVQDFQINFQVQAVEDQWM